MHFLKYAKHGINIRKALSVSKIEDDFAHLTQTTHLLSFHYEMCMRPVIQKETLAKMLLNAMLYTLFRN